MPVITTIEKLFPQNVFESFEAEHDADLCADIDFFSLIGKYAFGIQIRLSNNYWSSERMKASFDDFTKKYGGKVFIVYKIDDKIQNKEVIDEIRQEINRLKNLPDNS